MTYYDFLSYIFTPISYFVNWLHSVANSLLHNYIFITFLGIVLFISLFWLFFDTIFRFFSNKAYEYEDFNNLYEEYCKRQKVKYKYFENHYEDLYAYNYKLRVMNEQIYNHMTENCKNLLFSNKVNTIKINKYAHNYIKNTEDSEGTSDDKIFTKWHDKKTKQPLTKEEQEEINYLIDNF